MVFTYFTRKFTKFLLICSEQYHDSSDIVDYQAKIFRYISILLQGITTIYKKIFQKRLRTIAVSTTLYLYWYKNKETTMNKDKLYDLAFKFKKAALWDRMYEQELFAVKFSDDTLGYCSIMGSEGTHLALGIYLGYEGIDSFRRLSKAAEIKNVIRFHEVLLCQNCLQCSFEDKDQLSPSEYKDIRRYAKEHGISFRGGNAFPQFSLYEPSKIPWYVEKTSHLEYLHDALVAALDVGKRLESHSTKELGFLKTYDRGTIPLLEVNGDTVTWSVTDLPEQRKPEYPSPNFLDDGGIVAKLRKCKEKDFTFVCEVIMLPTPERDDELEKAHGYRGREPMVAPQYPYMLLILEQKSMYMLPPVMVQDYNQENARILMDFANHMQEIGKAPSRILVRDDRTLALLTDFAEKLGIELKKTKSIPHLDEVEEELFNHLSGNGEEMEDFDDEEAGGPDALDLGMDQFNDYFDSLGDKDSETIPPELMQELMEKVAKGEVPPELLSLLKEMHNS